MRAKMSDRAARDTWGAAPRGFWTRGTYRASLEHVALAEARAILAETEPETQDGERWDLEAFTPGCFRYAFPGAVACGQAYILDAPDALADALRAFVEG